MLRTERMRCDPAYRERLHACGLDTVKGALARIEGQVVAWSRTTDTLHVKGDNGTPGFFVKRYRFPRWSNRIRGAMRGTFLGMHRGRAEYHALNTMRAVGVQAVRAVAYGERRVGHFLAACVLITEEVPDSRNLTSVACDVSAGRMPLDADERRSWCTNLATQLAEMHGKGISHGNLFWRNVLVRGGPDGRPEFFFLDARPQRFWERIGSGREWWLRELAQFAVSAMPFTSRTEQLRFIRQYFGEGRLTKARKAQIREVARMSSKWRKHEGRRIHMNELFEVWNRRLADEAPECVLAGGGSAGGDADA